MSRPSTFGAGISERPMQRREQKRCGCGEPIISSKRLCWDCEAAKTKANKARCERNRAANRRKLAANQETETP